jgi:diacylglycerol kinase (ATP)
VEHPTLGPVLLVVNPRAGDGRRDIVTRVVSGLTERGIAPEVAATSGAGDATTIARQARSRGIRFVVAVGGDGTVNEVVNGLVDVTRGPDGTAAVRSGADGGPVLGVVSAGSGCDLVRTFGLDRAPEVIVRHLASPHVMPIDLGLITAQDRAGAAVERLFINIAEVGFGGAVAAAARRLPSRLGARRYRLGIIAAWGGFRRRPMRIRHDGGDHAARLCNVVIANGQFFGGGMKVAPRSLPDDGRFDLQAWGGSPTDIVRAARLLRDGSHLLRPDVLAWPSASVSVCADRPLPVEADGELVGWSPVRFEMLHRTLLLKT